MILQFGSLVGSLFQPLLAAGLDIGKQFISREINRGTQRVERNLIQQRAQNVASTVSFVNQPTGAFGPPFTSPGILRSALGGPVESRFPVNGAAMGPRFQVGAGMRGVTGRRVWVRTRDNCNVQHFRFNGSTMVEIELVPELTGPRFRQDLETLKFIKLPARRQNPFNFRATARAGRRIERTLNAVKGVVMISRKSEKGISAADKVVKFKVKKKKKAS